MSRLESLWKFYDEHAAQARQHEDQRERMTSVILVIAGALMAFISSTSSATIFAFISSLALIPLGVFGCLFSIKHYERNHLHRAILSKIRDAIDDELLPGPQGPRSDTLKQLRDSGEVAHYSNFPAPMKPVQSNATTWTARRRLNSFWSAIPLLVTILGIAFASVLAYQLWGPGKKEATPKPKSSMTVGRGCARENCLSPNPLAQADGYASA